MSNMIKIYSSSGTLITEAPCAKDCMRRFSLMQEDCVVVKFSHRDSMRFPIGSRIAVGADDFLITKQQQGKWNEATGVWSYELTFEAYYRAWANKILRYIIPGTDSPRETSFTLTATIDVHAAMLKNCLDFLGMKYAGSPFRIDTDDSVSSSEAKLVRYENLSVLGGIQAIAEAFECEWWVDGNAVCFGRLERERTDLRFEAGVNVSTISFADGKTTAPNRLYVFGSDRNLPPNYRPTDSGDTIGGVVARRLMLPEGTPYLQTSPDIPEREVVEAVVVFDNVYPRTGLTVDGDPEVYEAEAEQEDGTMAKESFYRLRYGSGFRFSSAYLLHDEELHIIFRSGLLNGMDFGARFNPKGFAEKNADGSWNDDAQMIEVVANEDYGRKLPDTILHPQKGDEFILYGWDATKMTDLGLIADAEAELLEEGKKALEEYAKDLSSCTCPMAWDYMKPLFMDAREPRPGDQVTIIDTAHFGDVGRKSRIIGYEYPLDKPYAGCTYTCGEAISERRLDSIEQKIEGLAQSGRKVQIRNSLDFLSKRYADRTPYKLSSDTAFEVGKFLAGVSGGIFGIDKASGKSFGEMDELFVRCKAYFESLTVIEAETLAGRNYITPGGSVKCVAVRDSGGAVKHPAVVAVDAQGNELDDVNDSQAVAYRCFYLEEQAGEKTLTKIVAGDQAISRTFNAQAGSQGQVTNHYWWRLVTAVKNAAYTDPDTGNVYGYIEVSRADCDKTANQNEPNGSGGWLACDIPADGDVIAHLGNRNDVSRQTAIILDTVGADAPSIKLFGGIDSFSLVDRDIVSFGYDSVSGRAYFRSYGSMLIGDREKNGAYAEFDERNKDLVIKGRIVASSPVVDEDGDDTGKTVSDLLNGVTDSRIYFIGHTSATSAPALPSSISDLNGWSATAPAWQQGRYVWQTTYIVKADGSESFSPAVCLSGAKGDQGTPGADGKDGKDGTNVTISSTEVRYSTVHNTASQPSDNTFTDTAVPSNLKAGDYLWSRTKVTYSNTQSTVSYGVSRIGSDGAAGTSVTITSKSVTYAKSTTTAQPADSAFTHTTIGSVNIGLGEYLWSKTTVKYSDNNSTNTYSVSRIGSDGADGLPGTPGKNGKTTYVHYAYANSADGSVGFSTVYFKDAKYVGVCTDYNTADPTTASSYTWSRLRGEDGKDGTPGNGIVRIVTEYYLSTSSTTPTGGSWSETRPAQWVYGQFLWTRSHVYYTDGSDDTYGEVCTEEFDYIKQSLKQAKNGVSITDGGLFLSSMIKLGIWDKTNPASPVQTEVRAGMNGIYDSHAHGGGVSTWWGGDMIDLFKAGTTGLSVRKTDAELGVNKNKAARALVRMNGSAYFANGNVGFEYDGSAWLGNENGLRVDKLGNITMGNGVTVNVSNVDGLQATLNSLTNFNIGVTRLLAPWGTKEDGTTGELSWQIAFNPDPVHGGIRAKSLKAKVGLWSNDFISARGQDGQPGGGGGSLFGLYSDWAQTPSDTDALAAPLGKELYTKFDDYYTALTIDSLLAAKASATHSHDISEITGLQAALNGKVPTSRKVNAGTGLMGGGALSADITIDLKPATASVIGGVKKGANINIATDGTISTHAPYSHPTGGANKTIAAATGKVLSAITVNSFGHVTSVDSKSLAATDIPGLPWSKITSGKPTTLAGYGITDALGVKNIGSKDDYQNTVILLWKDSEVTTHRLTGTLYTTNYGSARHQVVDLDLWFSRWGTAASNYDQSFKFNSYGQGTYFRLVTCTYNGEKWWGIRHTNAQACTFYFEGTQKSIAWTVVKYYNTNTTAVLNSEINGSIAEVNTRASIYSGSLCPAVNDTFPLGNTSYRWSTIYGVNVNLKGSISRVISDTVTRTALTADAASNTLIFGDVAGVSMMRGKELSFQNVVGTTCVKIKDGKMGIGTTAPSDLLTVNGTAKVTTLKIGSVTLTEVNGALHIDKGVYSDDFVSARGQDGSAGSGGSGGGLFGLNDTWGAVTNQNSADAFSDYAVWNGVNAIRAALDTRITTNANSISSLNTNLTALSDALNTVKGNYVTLATNQTINATKTFVGSQFIRFTADTSNAIGFSWRNVANNTTLMSIIGYNTAKKIIINPQGSAQTYNDAEGKYSLVIGEDHLTYNTKTILHAGNYAGILDDRYYTEAEMSLMLAHKVSKAGDTMTGALTIKTGADNKLIFNNTDGEKASYMSFREADTEYSSIQAWEDRFQFSKYLKAPRFMSTVATGTAPLTVASTTVVSNLNADMVDGKHVGNISGRIPIWTDFPGFATLIQDRYLQSDYASLNHPDELYFKALLKWATATYSGENIKLMGQASPNSQGFLHLAIYNTGLKQDGLPQHSYAVFHSYGGKVLCFGTMSYVWMWSNAAYYGALMGNADTATKLATARTIWGQSFNGTANVSGNMTGVGNITGTGAMTVKANGRLTLNAVNTALDLKFNNDDTKSVILNGTAFKPFDSASHKLTLGSSSAVWERIYGRYIDTDSGYNLRLCAAGTERVTIAYSTGNVGVGTTAPSYKVDVSGTLRATGAALFGSTVTASGMLTASGGVTIPSGKTLKIGSITLEEVNGALHVNKGVYSDDFISSRGSDATGAGGGSGFGLINKWPTSDPGANTTDALGANLGYALHTRVTALEGKNYLDALNVTTTGSGNAVTAVALSADKKLITVTKGTTFLTAHQAVSNKAATLAWNAATTIATVGATNITVKLPANPNTDTKNTAGSTNTSSKIFLIGATSQAANPQTYSHDTAYVGTDGCLYSGGSKVLDETTYAGILDARYYTEAEVTAKLATKVSKSGDTMTGALNFGSANCGIYNSGNQFVIKANDGVNKVVVNGTEMRRSGDISTLNLGNATYRWGTLYANAVNVTSATLVSNLNADMVDGVHNGSLTANKINANGTPQGDHALTWFSGPATIGTAAGNAYRGSSTSQALWSFPNGGTAADSAAGGVANIMNLRLGWNAGYWADIFTSPNYDRLWYRRVYQEDNVTKAGAWKQIAFTSDNVASANKLYTPRQINGTNFDGTAAITTLRWGTARNIKISDATATYTGAAVSVNGGADATLKLPGSMKMTDLYLTGRMSFERSDSAGKGVYVQGTANGSLTFCKHALVNNAFTWRGDVLYLDFNAKSDGTSQSGRVGVATTAPAETLDVNGTAIVRSAFKIGNTTSPAILSLSSGALKCNVGFYSDDFISARGQDTSSDARMKSFVESVSVDIAKIAAAPLWRFRWKDSGKMDAGSVAQYWQDVEPLLVHEYAGHLTLSYGKAAMLAAVTTARRLLEDERRIREHGDRIAQLEARVAELEAALSDGAKAEAAG